MTTPLLIKSHTGAMVPYRDGMVLRIKGSDFVAVCFHDVLNKIRVDSVQQTGGVPWLTQKVSPEHCIMLRFPFQKGDLVECVHQDEVITRIIKSEEDAIALTMRENRNRADLRSSYKFLVRHACADLQDEPDYRSKRG